MRTCPSCGNSYGDDARFCPMDATRLQGQGGPAADHAPPGTLVGLPAAPPVGPPPGPAQPALATDIMQRVVVGERFLLEQEFIDTPTGRLHRAADLQARAAPALVKIVPASAFPSPMLLDRALRELRQLGRVACAYVLRVLAHGRTPDGDLYIATAPPPDGAVLLGEAVARGGPFPPDRARLVVQQFGEALIEAHQAGVVHRNICPQAAYLSPGGEVHVFDFALAEVNEVKGRVVQGAPRYLAPEQAEGKALDQRSSVYSLGALYFHLLTGAPPFDGKDLGELLAQVQAEPPPAPSTRRPGLPREIDHLVQKALDKSSARRHVTLRQLLNELEEIGSVAAPAPRGSTRVMETALPGGEPRFAQTLIGVSPVTLPAQGNPVTPAALGAAFSSHASGAAAAGDVQEEGATVPMPLLSEEEMTATFGLSVPIGQRDTEPPRRAEAPIHDRRTEDMPACTGAAHDVPTLLGAETAVVQRAPLGKAPAVEAPPPEPLINPGLLAPAQQRAVPASPYPGDPVPSAPDKKRPAPFRETAWFKRGEIEDYLRDPARTGEVLVSAEDHARLSLRRSGEFTGGHGKPGSAPAGEAMSEAEILAELQGGSRRLVVMLLLAALGLLGGLAYVLLRP